jgi:hypothetical protein
MDLAAGDDVAVHRVGNENQPGFGGTGKRHGTQLRISTPTTGAQSRDAFGCAG